MSDPDDDKGPPYSWTKGDVWSTRRDTGYAGALRELLVKEGLPESQVNAIIDEGSGYEGSTTDVMLLEDLGPRRATTTQLRKIIAEGMKRGYNRRILDYDKIPPLDPFSYHVIIPMLVHRFIDGQPSEQHIRCRLLMKTLTSSTAHEFILDASEKSLRRLPRLKPKRRAKPDPTWEEVLEWYVELYEAVKSHPPPVDYDTGDGLKWQTGVPLELLSAQEPWFVSEDMVTLCEAAAEAMPSHTLTISELVTPTGFMVLERPLYVETAAEQWGVVPIRALVWKLVPPGFGMAGWPQSRSDRAVIACMAFMDLDHEDTPPDPVYAPGYRSRLWPVLHWLWPEGEPVDAVYNWENLTNETTRQAFMTLRKYFMATWLLSGQRIAGVTGQKPARGLRRRAERLQLPSTVLVVRLRRESSRDYDGEPAEVEWSHRWIVNGHWRRIWDEKTQRVRLVWVSPYVKGPEDKPLVVKDRIYKFDR